MNSNQKSSQGNKQSASKTPDNKQSDSRTGTQGGTHEQHVEAGRQSHKNDADKQSGTGNKQSGSSSGTTEQNSRQSNKNDRS